MEMELLSTILSTVGFIIVMIDCGMGGFKNPFISIAAACYALALGVMQWIMYRTGLACFVPYSVLSMVWLSNSVIIFSKILMR